MEDAQQGQYTEYIDKHFTKCFCINSKVQHNVEQEYKSYVVVNMHWTNANINHTIDRYQDVKHAVVISKTNILSNKAAVQHPGHS